MAVLNKRIMVSITEDMLSQMDGFLKEEGGKLERNKFVREAVAYYLKEKIKQRDRKNLAEGYREMAEINLRICQEYFLCEQEVMK